MKRTNPFIQILGWLIILLIIISPALLSARSIHGSGTFITVEKKFADFDRIQISHSFDARIEYGKKYRVVVTVDDNLEEYLRVEKEGNTLRIGMENIHSYRDAHLEVAITVPDIAVLGLSGASYAELNGFDFGHAFRINLSGASKVRGALKTGDLRLGLSGASDVKLQGNGDNLSVNSSGASTVNMDEFNVSNADLNLSGASKCSLYIDGDLDVRASGSSMITYRGKGRVSSMNMSGASRVNRI